MKRDHLSELRAHTIAYHETEQDLISTNPTLYESELENLTDSCIWIRLPIPCEEPKTVSNMIHSGVEELPNTCLAGILLEVLKNRVPKGVNLASLCIDNRDGIFRFCISGSTSLEDLRTLCEQHQPYSCQEGRTCIE